MTYVAGTWTGLVLGLGLNRTALIEGYFYIKVSDWRKLFDRSLTKKAVVPV